MKILGIGIDLVKNSRMQQYFTRNYSDRFLKKFLHPSELDHLHSLEVHQQQI